MEILRCGHCGAPVPPFAPSCAWCGSSFPPPPPPPPGQSAPLPSDPAPLRDANQLVIRGAWAMVEVLRVENESGSLLAEGRRSLEGLIGMLEMIMTDADGRFLLAFRLVEPPGRKFVQAPIPLLAVDDRGQPVGELHRKTMGWTGWYYELWNQGEPLMTASWPSRSQPATLLLRGTPVATITQQKSVLAHPGQGTWTVQFSAPCPHLSALALASYVAVSRGGGNFPSA